MTKILALDLGTTTGWAVNENGVITSGVSTFKPGRFEGGGFRFIRFSRWLTEMLSGLSSCDIVLFEEVRRHLSTDAAHCYGGLMAHLTAACDLNGVPYQGVPVQTIKKHATGRGNAKKPDIIAAMVQKGHKPKDDNEADALALLHWGIEQQ